MFVVVSRFRVANGMQSDVARAFRERPRSVESAPGFLWLEVLTDAADPAIFYLVTRWRDLASFDAWHGSPAHRDSHALIPKGLKLDASWTQVVRLGRLDEVSGSRLTDTLADALPLVTSVAEQSTAMQVLEVDADGIVLYASATARSEIAPDEALEGRRLTDYMPEADAVRLKGLLRSRGPATSVRLNFAARHRTPFTLECWLSAHDGGATLIGQPPFRREQQLQHELMAINEELAALARERSRALAGERQSRERAEDLHRAQNDFLRVLTHELRQPISGALAAMHVLRHMAPDPTTERPRALLERQLSQINRLVDDLADSAQVAAGAIELRRRPIDLAQQLREAATAWDLLAQQQQKALACEVPDTPITVVADPDRLQQVLTNLVGNAFKYTPAGRGIAVTLAADADAAVIAVRDEGEGIPPERLANIFDMFERATTTSAGLGIGLAVVRALVAAHGGTVSAESPGRGRGATFTVHLPLASPAP